VGTLDSPGNKTILVNCISEFAYLSPGLERTRGPFNAPTRYGGVLGKSDARRKCSAKSRKALRKKDSYEEIRRRRIQLQKEREGERERGGMREGRKEIGIVERSASERGPRVGG